MDSNYLIVHKSILPDYYEKVIEARNLIEAGEAKGVSEATSMVGISRSTFYKYKDYVFLPSKSLGRKATLSFFLNNKKGILSNLINEITAMNGNIITIHQDIPINDHASVTMTIDTFDIEESIENVLKSLKKINGVSSVKLFAIE